jgi:hypothetical protein
METGHPNHLQEEVDRSELSELSAVLHGLQARQALWELACRYAIALDDWDEAALGEMFAADAEFEGVTGRRAIGRAGVVEYLMDHPADYQERVHTPTSQILSELLDERAEGVVNSFAGHTREGASGDLLALRYDDVYVNEHGQWRFARRRIHTVRRILGP